jgi:hypothetical protein
MALFMLSEGDIAVHDTACSPQVGPPHRGEVGEEPLQLAVIEHAVLGEVLNASETDLTWLTTVCPT